MRYDPLTGQLYWKPRARHHFKTYKSFIIWNAKFANSEAFTFVNKGYKVGAVMGKFMKAHRVAWAIFFGEYPIAHIDHLNHDRADNRICNLRDVQRSENNKNRSINSNNTSGHNGVIWNKQRQKWQSRITILGNRIDLGCFPNLEAAVLARKTANKEHGFCENHGS